MRWRQRRRYAAMRKESERQLSAAVGKRGPGGRSSRAKAAPSSCSPAVSSSKRGAIFHEGCQAARRIRAQEVRTACLPAGFMYRRAARRCYNENGVSTCSSPLTHHPSMPAASPVCHHAPYIQTPSLAIRHVTNALLCSFAEGPGVLSARCPAPRHSRHDVAARSYERLI